MINVNETSVSPFVIDFYQNVILFYIFKLTKSKYMFIHQYILINHHTIYNDQDQR